MSNNILSNKIIISVVIIFLLFLEVYALEGDIIGIEGDVPGGTPGGPVTTGKVVEPEDIVIQIEADLDNVGSVNFADEPYKSNPEATLEALKEKYPNLDLNSIKGVKIDGNTLTTSDNSKIDLTTGKPITVETDGSTVTHFDDGETKILNGVGVEYKAGILKVELADRVN